MTKHVLAVFLLAAALSSPTTAMGQTMGVGDPSEASGPRDVRPPAPADPGKPALAVPYLLTFVLGATAVGLAILPSRRTHQD